MTMKKSPDVFEKEVRQVWGDRVELLTPYTRCADKVLVRFKECGHECWKNPNKLLAGQGCGMKECHYGLISKARTKTTEQFKQDLASRGLRYELLSEYVGVQEQITVKNLKCGHVYSAQADNILCGSGCPVCHGFKDTAMFKAQVEERYPGEYTILGEYVNNRTNILVRHNRCGYEWAVNPKGLLQEHRCPNCNKSTGEYKIERFLKAHDLNYQPQYTFDDCRNKRPLPFDFAVFDGGTTKLIEFDGTHHYRKFKGWGEKSVLSTVQEHDEIKNKYCETHNIPLLRIPYWKRDYMDPILAKFLNVKL